MTVMDDMDDGCDLEAPRAGSCWTRTFLPRGVRVRTSYAARNMRRSLNKAPSMLLAMVLSVHLTAWPIAMASVNMIQPTARQRIVNRERNEDALQDIVELVDRMHYGDMHATLQWDDSVDTLETTQVHAALRSESSFGQMTRALIETLRDPYSSYASKSEMELSPAALTFGLALQPADAERAAPMEGGGAADGVPARLLVSGVYAGSPAERAGLRTGDIVTEIGGVDEPAASLSKDALTALLRGRSLSLRVLRADAPVGAAAVGEWLTLSRDSKPYTPVMARALENGVGYLRIHQFTEKSTDELAAALAELAGAQHLAARMSRRAGAAAAHTDAAMRTRARTCRTCRKCCTRPTCPTRPTRSTRRTRRTRSTRSTRPTSACVRAGGVQSEGARA
jgi:hypothetical protein